MLNCPSSVAAIFSLVILICKVFRNVDATGIWFHECHHLVRNCSTFIWMLQTDVRDGLWFFVAWNSNEEEGVVGCFDKALWWDSTTEGRWLSVVGVFKGRWPLAVYQIVDRQKSSRVFGPWGRKVWSCERTATGTPVPVVRHGNWFHNGGFNYW